MVAQLSFIPVLLPVLGNRGRYISEFKPKLVCLENSRTARATWRNPVLKSQKKKKKKKKSPVLTCRVTEEADRDI